MVRDWGLTGADNSVGMRPSIPLAIAVPLMTSCWLRLAAGAALALATNTAAAQDVLRIGTEGAYPPYNMIDASGELSGFEIDLGNALCERLGMTCEFVAQDWDGIIPALANGRYDAIMAGMAITDERRERISFTQGYVTTPAWFVAAKDSDLQQAATLEQVHEALAGKAVGVQTSTIHQNFLDQEFGDDIDIRLYDTQDNVALDLASGRIDAGLADATSWQPFLESEDGQGFQNFGPSLTGDDFAVFGEGVGIGLRKDDEALLARLNEALCAMKADGSLAALATQWFGIDTSMSAPAEICGG